MRMWRQNERERAKKSATEFRCVKMNMKINHQTKTCLCTNENEMERKRARERAHLKIEIALNLCVYTFVRGIVVALYGILFVITFAYSLMVIALESAEKAKSMLANRYQKNGVFSIKQQKSSSYRCKSLFVWFSTLLIAFFIIIIYLFILHHSSVIRRVVNVRSGNVNTLWLIHVCWCINYVVTSCQHIEFTFKTFIYFQHFSLYHCASLSLSLSVMLFCQRAIPFNGLMLMRCDLTRENYMYTPNINHSKTS